MSTVDGRGAPGGSSRSPLVDLKLEAVVVPVAGADCAKAFYAGPGWTLESPSRSRASRPSSIGFQDPSNGDRQNAAAFAARAGADGAAMTVEDNRR
jgi:hypothetical protein